LFDHEVLRARSALRGILDRAGRRQAWTDESVERFWTGVDREPPLPSASGTIACNSTVLRGRAAQLCRCGAGPVTLAAPLVPLIGALLFAAACYSSPSEEEPRASTLEAHFRSMVTLVCASTRECCAPAASSSLSAEECAAQQDWFIQRSMGISGDYAASIAAGRVTFAAAEASSCRAALADVSCEQWRAMAAGGELPASCGAVFTGLRSVGQACNRSVECASTFCDRERFAGEPALIESGVCRERAGAGAACRSALLFDAAPCQRGLYCHAPRRGELGVCESMRPEEEPCEHETQCWGECPISPSERRCTQACSASLYVPFTL
jgi:hypothetical protein